MSKKNQDVARCDNCGTEYKREDLDCVDNLSERIYAGEEVPAGQCPDEDCQACCFLIEDLGDYEDRVRALESEGMTRSDAQAVADAELMT